MADEEGGGWRALEETEVALLEALTALPFGGSAELRRQIAVAVARPGCRCGCGTIDLMVERDAVPPAAVRRSRPVPGEAQVVSGDAAGAQVVGGLILFVDEGYLDSLEVYSHGDPLPLPAPSDIRTFVRDA